MDMRQDCEQIVKNALDQVRPDGAVCRALAEEHFGYGRLILVAVGKAAWSMANAACEILDRPVDAGIELQSTATAAGRLAVWRSTRRDILCQMKTPFAQRPGHWS